MTQRGGTGEAGEGAKRDVVTSRLFLRLGEAGGGGEVGRDCGGVFGGARDALRHVAKGREARQLDARHREGERGEHRMGDALAQGIVETGAPGFAPPISQGEGDALNGQVGGGGAEGAGEGVAPRGGVFARGVDVGDHRVEAKHDVDAGELGGGGEGGEFVGRRGVG